MYIYILAILNILLVLDLLRRVGPFAVATVSAGVFSCAMIYYGFTDAKYTALVGITSNAEARLSALNELPVEFIYSLGTLLTWLSVLGIRKVTDSGRSILETQRGVVDSWLTEKRFVTLAAIMGILCMQDAIARLIEPAHNEFSLFWKLSGFLCMIASAVAVLSWNRGYWGVILILMPIICYTAAPQLAFYSRNLVLIVGVATAVAMELRARRGKSRLSLLTAAGLIFALALFLFALQGRGDRRKGYDWPSISANLASIDFGPEAISKAFGNVFFGPSCLAGAMDMHVTYPLQYQLKSLSPLPSGVDGGPSDGGINLQKWTPFSAIAEAYYFDWPYKICFIAIYMLCVRRLTKLYCQYDEVFALLLSGPGIISCLIIQQYPIRNSLRMLMYSAFVSYLFSKYMDRKMASVAILIHSPINSATAT